ncbi:MAG TPA: enoyl-CoA hydratase/isomerase family protein [Acidimicrobiales bacterium]|nr:enoyl-CoA hydratase/isomerase family protein [Acidimicrobiales bacterium]
MTDPTTSGPAVVVGVDGCAGRITLNRPKTLNALTHEMVRLVDAALDRFAGDDEIATVVVDGAGGRALCAGGDIRSIYEAARTGDPAPKAFWADEYRLDARIARYSKPVVAIMDGIVMGGGVGISAHASHRVVTERSVVAMPEVGIGFAPDVGGTWLLSHAPGELGTHVALTAGSLGPADAIEAGLADVHVATSDLPAVFAALAHTGVDGAIAAVTSDPPAGQLAAWRRWIDRCYQADTVEEIVDRLLREGGHAAAAANDILTRSPTSLKVALRALRQARGLPNLERALEVEYRISTTFLCTADFVEGVRAQVIDKDRRPRWNPASLAEVSDADLDRFFAPRPDDIDLTSPLETARR